MSTESVPPPGTALSSRSRISDDVASLTSFNPFSEDDDNDKSSYTLVTSIFSRMKNTLSAPLASTTQAAVPSTTGTNAPAPLNLSDQRRLSHAGQSQVSAPVTKTPGSERRNPLHPAVASAAPPLVSLTPAQSEVLSYNAEHERSPSRSGAFYSPVWDSSEGALFGTSIPGFPIPDDARSIRTSASFHRSASVSKVIRRLRGEGLSRHYWMEDENCKECYDCKSIFTTWRRKHHCRICGQIFCSRCASNVIKGSRFGQEGMVRVCNLCLEKLATVDEDEDDRRSVVSSAHSAFPAHQLGGDGIASLSFHPQSPFSTSQIFERKEDPFNLYSIAENKRPLYDGELSPERHDNMWEATRENPAPFRRALSDEEKDSGNLNGTYNQEDVHGSSPPVHLAKSKNDANSSTVQFPVGSPDQDSPQVHDRFRDRFNSYGDSDTSTPFIRSRVQSRLDSITSLDIGWRTRRESTAYAQELNLASMLHLKFMLRQMLAREEIPNIKEWEETLSRLALKIAREMTFTALPHRQGEDMDIRRYVKIKKIPGGAPQDSEYNVAHKQMSRSQKHPRVMLYMPFGQIVRQEKEYLANLVARIAALRPHIVLVERSHNIAVARSVKTSAADLALEPRMGHCGRYRLQTFDHPLIPNRRKTYMRFEGCSPDMGADIATLRRLKKITRFLETHLWKDSAYQDGKPVVSLSVQSPGSGPFSGELTDEEAEQRHLSRRIEESLEPYMKTFISVSATLQLDIKLKEAKRAWEDEIVRREERIQVSHSKESTFTEADKGDTALKSSQSWDSLARIESNPGREDSGSYFSDASASTSLSYSTPPMPYSSVASSDIRLESRLSYLKVWEWYLRKNKDDFVVETYQRISLWEYTCRACFAPRLNYMTFYGQCIEQAIIDPKALCAGKNCDQPLARHCKVYPLDRLPHLPPPDLTMTWSTCRICYTMQRYSFAKFLELHFYPADVKLVQGAGCEHNIYQHHTRYFALKGMTVRFQSDPITLHEIVCPPTRIRIRPETQLQLKNADYQKLHRRNIYWYSGLIDDLRLINEKHDASLLAEAERDEIARLINRVYRESAPTDTVALNKKIVAWQQDFDRLPKPRPHHSTEKASRRPSAFNSVRAIWPRRPDIVSEAEEGSIETESVINEKQSAQDKPSLEAETSNDVPVGNETASELSTQAATEDEPQISELESDSTIGAPRYNTSPLNGFTEPVQEENVNRITENAPHISRLPRRSVNQPTVAELVRKYQDFLPAQGVQDLAKTALSPRLIVSESEQEYTLPVQRRATVRTKTRHQIPRKSSVLPVAGNSSRIPGPVVSAGDSHTSSRRTSPDKRFITAKTRNTRPGRPSSPLGSQGTTKRANNRVASQSKDKSPRVSSNMGNKSGIWKPPSSGVKVSTMTRHFERLSRDAERSKTRYSVIRGKRARPVTSAHARVVILPSVQDAIKDETDVSDASSEADDEADANEEDARKPLRESATTDNADVPSTDASTTTTEDAAPPAPSVQPETETVVDANLAKQLPGPVQPPPSPPLDSGKQKLENLTSDLETLPIGTERGSFFRALSGLLLQQPLSAKQTIEIDDSMNDPEYIYNDSSMIVRTDEPTSMVALALDSPQYRDMLSKSRAEKRTAREAKLTDGGEAFMPDDNSVAESTSTWGVVNLESSDLVDPMEELRMPSSKSPWVITIDSGGLTISCTVLYPEQFDALRRAYDCERSMVESLSRCVKWNASGGKSGSAFLKTKDDRFIAKELSRPELQTMETFAPSYFEYMSSAVSANRPTLLAKVFGCYKLTFKKNGKDKAPGRSKSFQMNLLVMENLFYDRHFTKIYDLKGSTRNRHVQSTGREDEVLLDENLVETAHLHPFYLREHSKRILRGALHNDTKFLADINVMDYSLLCGVDSQKNELVIGIVDYQRTYTWDKKLESWVKESAFLGGGRGEPTIVTPKQYRQRFLSSMERYFPLIPDRWMKQRDTPEEDPNCLTELWPDWYR
ncbi:hypothetical protein F5887DRAFT_958971 [Amanita rubescens]|nr:hypothetical protein F5887DRAFT_958971 [Amanita rubescens]